MKYKDYKSFQVKNGHIDVFVMMVDDHEVYEMFITDYLTQSTSSAIFSNQESFKKFTSFLLDMMNE